MKIRSFAKINLGLEVIGKREDSYHEIKTIFQAIDLFDVLEFKSAHRGEIILKGDDESIPWDRNNLIFRAALLLKEQFNLSHGAEIHVTKNIPPGKGFGGGSSNAALTLYALNKKWGLRLNRKDLMELGRTLGADVPFFLEGGLCLGLERGDKIVPIEDLMPLMCLLVLPSFSISTSKIYAQLALTSRDKDSKINRFLADKNFSFLENRLEETVLSLYPQLRVIKDLIQSLGANLSLISGTGSAVFGLFRDKDKAERGLEELKKRYPSLLAKTLSRESYWNKLYVGV